MKSSIILCVLSVLLSANAFSQTIQISKSEPVLTKKELGLKHTVLGMFGNSIVSVNARENNEDIIRYIALTDKNTLKSSGEIILDFGKLGSTFKYNAETYLIGNNVYYFFVSSDKESNRVEIGGIKVDLEKKSISSPVVLTSYEIVKSSVSSEFKFSLSGDSSKILLINNRITSDNTSIIRSGLYDRDLKLINESEFARPIEKGSNMHLIAGYVYPSGDYVFAHEFIEKDGVDFKKRKITYSFHKIKANGEKTVVELEPQQNIVKNPKLITDDEGKLFLTGYYLGDFYVFGIASADVEKCLSKSDNITFSNFQEPFKSLKPNYPIHSVTILPVKGKSGEFYFVSQLGGWLVDYDGQNLPEDISRNIFILRYNCNEKKEIWVSVIFRDVLKPVPNARPIEAVLNDLYVLPIGNSLAIFYQNHMDNESKPEMTTKKLTTLKKIGKNSCAVAAKVNIDGSITRTILFDETTVIDPQFQQSMGFDGKNIFVYGLDDDNIKLIAIKNIF